MTDTPPNMPKGARDAFLADQEAAQAEETTRDQQSWALNVRNGEANASVQEMHAAHLAARASLWLALSSLVRAATVFLALAFGAVAFVFIAGIFQ